MSEKLVRDKIVDYVFNKRGEVLSTRVASQDELTQLLKQKIVEEANEVFATNNKEDLAEELGDLMEAMRAIAEKENIVDQLFSKMEAKFLERGGFEKGIVLIENCKK